VNNLKNDFTPNDTGPPTIIADSGATDNYLSTSCPVKNKRITDEPIQIQNPNGEMMTSTHIGDLDLPLRPAACRAHIVPALKDCSLLSIGAVCDAGYTVDFTAHSMRILDKDKCMVTGHRRHDTGMWHVDLPPQPVQFAHRIGDPKMDELVAYAHAAMFSPALTTLETALTKGFLTNFPGLTAATLRRHPPTSIPMAKGHLDQTRKNQRSTKQPPTLIAPLADDPTNIPDDFHPASTEQKTHHCFATFMEPTGQIFTDQTGRFVTPSGNGNQYLMILYDYDSNHIFAQPFKTRSAANILTAFKILHRRLCRAGCRPKLHRLDNECSTILKTYLTDEAIDYQLVPPGVHRRNAAERAIRTFQNHFIAGLCSVDKDFPIHLWDHLVTQAEITLNLLRSSRINPKLSAHAQINGHFDYNRTPIGPPGCRVLAHVKTSDRTTWSPHGLDGWYVGPATESYRCWRIWIFETRSIRTCDTVTWFPTKVTMPNSSSNDLIVAALHDIVHALRHPSPKSPLAPSTDSQSQALQMIVELLTNSTATKESPAPPLRVAPPGPALLRVPTTPALTDPPSPTPHLIPLDATHQHEHQPPPRVAVEAPAATISTRIPDLDSDDTADRLIDVSDDATVGTSNVCPPQVTTVPLAEAATVPHVAPTYAEVTGPAGQRRRRRQRQQKKRQQQQAPIDPPPAEPLRRSKRKRTPKKRASHAIRGRGKTGNKHRSSHTKQPIMSDTPIILSMTHDDMLTYRCMHGTAINPDTGNVAEYKALSKSSDGPLWAAANKLEIGRMFQGLGPDSPMPDGTDCLRFIKKHHIPKHKIPTYIRVVCADRPEKAQIRRVRWTAGGDRIEYSGNKTCRTAGMTTAKLLFNSVVSTPKGRFMTIDLKDFYLCSILDEFEYVKIPIWMIPQDIIDLYELEDKIVDGFVYAQVRKGMYGLPQAGRLANEQLRKFLKPHGFEPCPITPGLWKDLQTDLMFSLVVDDFGIRYTSEASVQRLIYTLKKKYELTTDWTGSRYVGLTLDWDYENRTVDLSMPGYVERALQRFEHSKPERNEDSPHAWTAPDYGARQQYATHDESPLLDVRDIKRVQEVLGTFLFYGRAVDLTMVTSIGSIATEQASATELTMKAITQLLNYAACNPDATLRYHASDMILYVESDASYLSESKARSRVAGFHYLSDKRDNLQDPNATPPPFNGAISIPCKVLKAVLASAAETELAGLFVNGQEAVPERITLEELGHPQGPTPMCTDNKTGNGIANDTIKQKRSKAMDMRFYWIRDRVRQGQFLIYWRPGKTNRADYFTKHHPAKHHRRMRPYYLHTPTSNRFAPLADAVAE
jgi:hypothetical protein